MFLSGKKFFDYTTDTRSSGYEPNFRWTKPSISIVGEAQYSDGHCYAFAYQFLKIGKLVGMPVPGTCSFAGWEMLGDIGHRLGRRARRRQGARRRLSSTTTRPSPTSRSPTGREEVVKAATPSSKPPSRSY